MYNVRETTQRSRNELELDLLARAWPTPRAPAIASATFRFGGDPVLSWKLTRDQRSEIGAAWQKALTASESGIVTTDRFFRRPSGSADPARP
jgi:hypothetical protein